MLTPPMTCFYLALPAHLVALLLVFNEEKEEKQEGQRRTQFLQPSSLSYEFI